MNYILDYVADNWESLRLDGHAAPDELTCVLMTPRFRASSHVIYLILSRRRAEPVMVAKVARQPSGSTGVEREVLVLSYVHACRPGGFDSVPKVLACEPCQPTPFLLETALRGRALSPAMVRRRPEASIRAVASWLAEIQLASMDLRRNINGWYERLVVGPLRLFADTMPLSPQEQRWLAQTEALVASLRGADLPLVLEHGDLGHPNLLTRKDGRVGVVDWEQAEVAGLPALDMFFFLTYVAFARRKARTIDQYLAAFQEAFFEPVAWARPHLHRYAERLRLPYQALPPLFVLCWLRYVANLAGRAASAGLGHAEAASWLRANRYYQLWRHTIEHFGEVRL